MSPEVEYLQLFISLAVVCSSAAQRHNPLLDDSLLRDKSPADDLFPSSRIRQSSSLSLLDDPLLDAVTSLGRQSLLDELLSAGHL